MLRMLLANTPQFDVIFSHFCDLRSNQSYPNAQHSPQWLYLSELLMYVLI
jgi:hypothetical protein